MVVQTTNNPLGNLLQNIWPLACPFNIAPAVLEGLQQLLQEALNPSILMPISSIERPNSSR